MRRFFKKHWPEFLVSLLASALVTYIAIVLQQQMTYGTLGWWVGNILFLGMVAWALLFHHMWATDKQREAKHRVVVAHLALQLAEQARLDNVPIANNFFDRANVPENWTLCSLPSNQQNYLKDICTALAIALKTSLDYAYQTCEETTPGEQFVFRAALFMPERVVKSVTNPDDDGRLALYIQGTSADDSRSYKDRGYFCKGRGYAGCCWKSGQPEIGTRLHSNGQPDARWVNIHDGVGGEHDFEEILCIPVFSNNRFVGVISLDTTERKLLDMCSRSKRHFQIAVEMVSASMVAMVRAQYPLKKET